MAKVNTNITLDSELKKQSQELFSDLGLDLTTAVTLFLKQSLRSQGLPFEVKRDNYNADTVAAMNEFYLMKERPELYKRYSSFKSAMDEVLNEDA